MMCCASLAPSNWARSMSPSCCEHSREMGILPPWRRPLRNWDGSPKRSIYQLRGIQLINRRKQACFFLFSIGASRTHHASEAVSRLRSEAEHPQGLALTWVSGVVSSESARWKTDVTATSRSDVLLTEAACLF